MSLTIFLHNKRPEVDIVCWFKDSRTCIEYAKAPIVSMTLSDFRSNGYDWILQHFHEYKSKRIHQREASQATELFATKSVKKLMEDSDVIGLSIHNAEWLFTPFVVRRNVFPNGMEILEKDKRRVAPANCSPETFWKTFDEVFQFTHWYNT